MSGRQHHVAAAVQAGPVNATFILVNPVHDVGPGLACQGKQQTQRRQNQVDLLHSIAMVELFREKRRCERMPNRIQVAKFPAFN
jgi:hypothetical protein